MNFDDESLWLKLYQALSNELQNQEIELKELMKMLSILENICAPETEEEDDQ